jgi:hypothetical protein
MAGIAARGGKPERVVWSEESGVRGPGWALICGIGALSIEASGGVWEVDVAATAEGIVSISLWLILGESNLSGRCIFFSTLILN